MTNERLPASRRLTDRRDIQHVFDVGRTVSNAWIVLRGCATELGVCRFAPLASKRLGGAVERNRWKRRLREAFRLTHADWPPGIDIVALPRAAPLPPLAELRQSLPRLAAELASRSTKQSPRRPPPKRATEPPA